MPSSKSKPAGAKNMDKRSMQSACQNRLETTERCMGTLSEAVKSITTKEVSVLDRYTNLAKELRVYAESETDGIREATLGVSAMVDLVQVHRNAYFSQVHARVTEKLTDLRKQSGDLKHRVDKMRKGGDIRSDKTLASEMKRHEQSKLNSLKTVLQDFISSQMVFHARSLEVLSESFDSMSSISENSDLRWILDLKRSFALQGEEAESEPEDKEENVTKIAEKSSSEKILAKSPQQTPLNQSHIETKVIYPISVITADHDNASTMANVYIKLYGSNGNSDEYALLESSTHKKKFQRGNTDEFVLSCANLGELQKVRIRHDNSGPDPDWMLDAIEVDDTSNKLSYAFDFTNTVLSNKRGTSMMIRELSEVLDLETETESDSSVDSDSADSGSGSLDEDVEGDGDEGVGFGGKRVRIVEHKDTTPVPSPRIRSQAAGHRSGNLVPRK